MKKTICSTLLALTFILYCPIADAVTLDAVEYDKTTGTAVISGETQSGENGRVVLHILSGELTENDIESKSDAEIRSATVWFEIIDSADGKFELEKDMNLLTADEGVFTVRAASNGEDTALTVFTHYSEQTLNQILSDAKNASSGDETAEIFKESYEIFVTTPSLESKADEVVLNSDGTVSESIAEAAGTLLYDMSGDDSFAASYGDFENQLVLSAAIAAVNTGDYDLIEYIVQNDISVLKSTSFSSDVYEALADFSDSERQSAAKRLESFANTYSSCDSFYDDLYLAVMLEMLEASYGTDGKERALKTFDDKLDFTIYSKSGNDKAACLESIQSAADSGKIDSFDAVQKILDTYNKKTETSSKSSGGSSGSGSGSGSYGAYVPGENGIDTNASVAVEQAVAFTDTDGVPWAEESINRLASLGIISGIGDNLFAPDDYVTRAQFAKILCGCFGIVTDDTQSDFSDVSENEWYAPYINALEKRGIVNGLGNGIFGVDSFITRQDMAVIIYNAGKTIFAGSDTELSFTDSESIADYALGSVRALCAEGLINGMDDGTFAPASNATRAETAKLMDAVEKFVKKAID